MNVCLVRSTASTTASASRSTNGSEQQHPWRITAAATPAFGSTSVSQFPWRSIDETTPCPHDTRVVIPDPTWLCVLEDFLRPKGVCFVVVCL